MFLIKGKKSPLQDICNPSDLDVLIMCKFILEDGGWPEIDVSANVRLKAQTEDLNIII